MIRLFKNKQLSKLTFILFCILIFFNTNTVDVEGAPYDIDLSSDVIDEFLEEIHEQRAKELTEGTPIEKFGQDYGSVNDTTQEGGHSISTGYFFYVDLVGHPTHGSFDSSWASGGHKSDGDDFDSYFLRAAINPSRKNIETSVHLSKNSEFDRTGRYTNFLLAGNNPGGYYGTHHAYRLQEAGILIDPRMPPRGEFLRSGYHTNYTYSFPNAQRADGSLMQHIRLNSLDYERAQYVGDVLSNSLNSAINYMTPSGHRLTESQYLELNYNLMEAFTNENSFSRTSSGVFFSPLSSFGIEDRYELKVFSNNESSDSIIFDKHTSIPRLLDDTYNSSTLGTFGDSDGFGSYSFLLQEVDNDGTPTNREPGIFLFSIQKYVGEYTNRSGVGTQAMSVQLLQLQALRDYYVFGRTSAHPLSEPSQIEKDLMGVYENTLNGVRNLLGLTSINDLVFNEGTRSNYYYGIFPKDWVDSMSIYYIILNILAIVSLAAAVLKILFQQTFAIMNPNVKTSFMNSVQRILLVILLLAGFFPMFNILARLNYSITQIFMPITPDMSMLSATGSFNGLLSGLIVSTGFFVIMIIFNVIYILRAISIAILVALAPICIASLAFGDSTSNIFGTWFKELIANIFIQSLHVITFGLAFRFFCECKHDRDICYVVCSASNY